MVPATERHTSLVKNRASSKSVEVAGERLSWCAKNVALHTGGISSAASTRENGGKEEPIRSECANQEPALQGLTTMSMTCLSAMKTLLQASRLNLKESPGQSAHLRCLMNVASDFVRLTQQNALKR